METRKKKVLTCYFEAEQVEALKRLHAATKIPVSVLIREGIDMVIQYREGQQKGS